MYKPGQWRALCDVCGFKFYSGELKKRWDGLMVCSADFETDHPQKYLRVRAETMSVPFVRNSPTDTFVNVCYIWGRQSYANLGEAGCIQAGVTTMSYDQATFLKQGT